MRPARLAALACSCAGLLQAACSFPEYTFAEDGSGGSGSVVSTGGSSGATGGDVSNDGGGDSGGSDSGGSGGAGGSGASGGVASGGTGSVPAGGGGTTSHACDDGEQNGDETDVDCGGEDCLGCKVGALCETSSDCATNNCNPNSTKCETSLKIECHCINCSSTWMPQAQMVFKVFNQGAETLNLQQYKLRYYFDQNQDESAKCTSAPFVGGCAQVITNDVAVDQPVSGADRFTEVGFTSGAGLLTSMERSGEMTITFTATGNASFDQTDDHSWIAATDFVTCNDWTAWRVGVEDTLIFGNEPN